MQKFGKRGETLELDVGADERRDTRGGVEVLLLCCQVLLHVYPRGALERATLSDSDSRAAAARRGASPGRVTGGGRGSASLTRAAPPAAGDSYCYLTTDVGDAMEGSISGGGCRPTIGAMMYSDALAIAALADELGGAHRATADVRGGLH